MSDETKSNRRRGRVVVPVQVIDVGQELDKFIGQLVEVALGYGVILRTPETSDQQLADAERIVLESAEDAYTAFENLKELSREIVEGVEITCRVVTKVRR